MYFIQSGIVLALCTLFVSARIVQLPYGQLKGADRGNYYSFTNIPYAEPPIRFEPSVPYHNNWNGIRNATEAIVECVPFYKGSSPARSQEDCLILNVFTPKTATDKSQLPVFIFIHGGAFMFSYSGRYSPEAIMEQGNMIVVSINYRLGPFGFLASEDWSIPGNLGLKDQLLALRWIKKNIYSFGGNPEKILLTGNSAGGASVHLHVLRQETENLISAAVSLSGCALNPWVMQRNPQQKTKALAKLLKCPSDGEEMKLCFQNRSAQEFYDAVAAMQPYLDNPFNLFGPVVEPREMPDAFLTEDPRYLIEKGRIANIPWMATLTSEEGAFNAGSLLRKNKSGVEYIEDLNERWLELAPSLLFYYDIPSEQAKQAYSLSLRKTYMGDNRFSRDTYLLLQKMYSDVLFIDGILESIQLHSTFGQNPVYSYIYANPHNFGVGNLLSNDTTYQFGAAHGDDNMLFMPLTTAHNYISGINDKTISRLLIHMFETFASEGVPSFGSIVLPANSNTDPAKLLQIFSDEICLGPWESLNNGKCHGCYCKAFSS